MADRTVSVGLRADVAGFIAGIRSAQSSVASFTRDLEKNERRKQALLSVGNAAGIMGAAAAAGVGVAIKAAADFDKAMSSVQAATRGSAKTMEQLRAAALKAGADTAFSATEAAAGIENLAKAGVSTKDILRGGLTGALDLAAAGQIDVATAAESAATAMTQFGLKGADVPHVADLLAAAAGKAQGEVTDFTAALNQAGLVANQTGQSIETTTGVLAAFASRGLMGSDAGTSLKTFLGRLVPASKEAYDALNSVGLVSYSANTATRILAQDGIEAASNSFVDVQKAISGYLADQGVAEKGTVALADATEDYMQVTGIMHNEFLTQKGDFKDLDQIAGELKESLKDLSASQRASALQTIFGTDAVRAANVLYDEGAAGISRWIKKVNDQGFAAETAATKMDNLAGDLEEFKGSLETALIGAGSGAQGPLRSLVQTATDAVNAFNKLPQPVKNATLAFGGLVAVTGGATFLGSRFIAAIADGRTALRDLGITSAKTGESVSRSRMAMRSMAGLMGGPWGIALAAGVGTLALFLKAQNDAEQEVKDLTQSLNQQTGAVTRNTTQQVINTAQKDNLFDRARRVGISAEMLTRALLGEGSALAEVNRRLNATIDANKGYSNSGVTVTETTHGLGLEAEYLQNALGQQNGALAEARRRWRENNTQQRVANDVMRDTRDLWQAGSKDARQLGEDVKDIPDRHDTKLNVDKRDAERNVNDFVRNTNSALNSIENEDVELKLTGLAKLAASGSGPLLEGFAAGGEVRGGLRGKDSVPAMLMPGEHVFTTSDVEKAGGQRAMFAIRKMIQTGEFARKGDLQYYAAGGAVVSPSFSASGVGSAIGQVSERFDAIADAIAERLSARINKAFQFGGGRPLGPGGTLSPGQVMKGQEFAKRQAGLPYQWGGTGNPSWDCSGLVGGTWAAALGRSPYQRYFTTASFGTGGAYGFRPGPGVFTVGNDPGSHMASNMGGLGVESRGGDGVVLGGGITPLSSFAHMAHYDQGGPLYPGWTLAYNGTGQTEYVHRFYGNPSQGGRGGGSSSPRGPVRVVVDLGDGIRLRGMMHDAAADVYDGRESHSRRMAGMR